MWVVWFYELLAPATLASYLSSIYPPLAFVTYLLLRGVSSLVVLSRVTSAVLASCVVLSSALFLLVRGSSSQRLASMLATLTSVTFLLVCAVALVVV
jgi:hypothetical protein